MKSYKGRLLTDFAKDGQKSYSNTKSLVLCDPCAGCLKACNHAVTAHVVLSDNCSYMMFRVSTRAATHVKDADRCTKSVRSSKKEAGDSLGETGRVRELISNSV